MNRKVFIPMLIMLTLYSIASVSAQDYSKYRYEDFSVPRTNPAFLVTPGGNASNVPLRKLEGNNWGFPLGPFWYVTLPQPIRDKILRAKDNKDNFILFYQRKGAYVDISKYTGTTDPDLIRRDTQGQTEYIRALARAYTFVADDILTYSEIMVNAPQAMKAILLNEENKPEEYGGMKIFQAFADGQMTGARNYVNTRIKAIETATAQAQAERNAQAQKQVVEEQRRQNERKAAEERANTLRTATIMGYKPCFNIDGSSNATPYESHSKIAVIGFLENQYNSFGDEFSIKPINFNNNQRGSFRLTSSASLETLASVFPSIVKKSMYGSMTSYYCIFFLTKTSENESSRYTIDHYIFLGDLTGKAKEASGRADVKQAILEDWIVNNNGKQNIQFLNAISISVTPVETITSKISPSTTVETPIVKRTVNGYEPCFNIGGTSDPTPYNGFSKIMVAGYFYNSYDNDYQIKTYNYNHNQKANISLAVTSVNKDVFNKIVRRGYSSDSYICIFFLSKLENREYSIDSFKGYGDIVGEDNNSIFANDISKTVLEDWITQNHD